MPVTVSTYDEWMPAAANAFDLACTWVGVTGDDGGYVDRVLPDACIDVVWDGTRLFVAGPDTGPVVIDATPGTTRVGVRFRPGHAPRYLGLPASSLLDQRVDLADLWDASAAARAAETIASCDAKARRSCLEAIVISHRADFDDRNSAAADDIAHHASAEPVDALAERFGFTTRTLHRRCVDAFGYGAKTLQRVLRFRDFLALAERDHAATLGVLAAQAGYADQSHLVRECTALAGLTPSALLVSRGVRSVQDTDGAAGAR